MCNLVIFFQEPGKKSKNREEVKAALFRDPKPQEPAQILRDQSGQGHSSQTNQLQASLQAGVETQTEINKQLEGNQTLESYLTDQYSSSTPVVQPMVNRSDNMLQSSQLDNNLQETMEVDPQNVLNQSEKVSPEAEGSVRFSSTTDTASELGTEPSTSGSSSMLVRTSHNYYGSSTLSNCDCERDISNNKVLFILMRLVTFSDAKHERKYSVALASAVAQHKWTLMTKGPFTLSNCEIFL